MYEHTGQYYAFFGPKATTTDREEQFFAHWSKGRTRALDFGAGLCGPALGLARLGLDVLAFEPSPVIAGLALDRLGRLPAQETAGITLVAAKPEALREPFAAEILLMRSVWMLLDDAQRATALAALQRHAAPEALLIIDARTAALRWADEGDVNEERKLGHSVIHRRTTYSRLAEVGTRVDWTIEVTRFGRSVETYQESFVVRADTFDAVRSSLAQAGFEVEKSYGAYDLDAAASEASPMLVAVARLRRPADGSASCA